jgi:hypothetical protein
MASALTVTEIDSLALGMIQAKVTTNAPFDTARKLEAYNNAYQEIWSLSGGRKKNVTSVTAWAAAQTTTSGIMTGILDNVEDVLHAWYTTASASTGGTEATDFEIVKADRGEILWNRARNATLGTYGTIQMFSFVRGQTATNADKNKGQLDFWPAIATLYIPIEYVQQFVPFTAINTDFPELTDIESRDLAYLAALELAPLASRGEFMETVAARISNVNQILVARRFGADLDARQDRVA